MTGCPNQLWCTWARRHTDTHAPSRCLLITMCHAQQLHRSEGNWQKCASHLKAATALTAPRLKSTWVFTVTTDGPQRQASGFRWWVRKSSSHQECSSPAELSCILLPTQAYSIYHLHNVTVGDKMSSAQIESNQLWCRGTSKWSFSHQERT